MEQAKTKAAELKSQTPLDEIADLLVTILEECGVWGDSTGEIDVWNNLASAVDKLAIALERLDLVILKPELSQSVQDEYILAVEQESQNVRCQCEIFSNKINDRSETIDLCLQLGSCCYGRDDLSRIQVLSRSILEGVRQQTFAAENVTQSVIHNISGLHGIGDVSTPNASYRVTSLRKSAETIRKRCIYSKSPPWSQAIELLKLLQSDEQVKSILDQHGVSLSDRHVFSEYVSTSMAQSQDDSSSEVSSVLSSKTVFDAVETFLSFKASSSSSYAVALLVVGSQGSGKTHLCNEIQKLESSGTVVVRPSLAFDSMGCSVGETEDLLISLFSFARSRTVPCILILDDIENIFGDEYVGPSRSDSTGQNAGEPHLQARDRSMFLSALDVLKKGSQQGNNRLLVICTAKSNIGEFIGRFDKVVSLTPPDANERRTMIESQIGIVDNLAGDSSQSLDSMIQTLLLDVVECTIGMSYAEISQYCRQAVQTVSSRLASSRAEVLRALKRNLQSSMPESLRSGVNDDFVDMTVLTARDLLRSKSGQHADVFLDFPLYGDGAQQAWQELQRLIVMPLCRTKALDKLLYQRGGQGGKVFQGGVLLTGPPGCGKSVIAYHCAAAAAALIPSIKLIDVSCTSLIHKEVGGSERAVHRLFESARAAAPCILLMDGIENVAAVRGNDNTTEGTMDRVLSTLLTELDGVDNTHFSQDKAGGIAIIAITHNVNWIDPALRRPGRLEKVIEVGRPEFEARLQIVLKEIRKTPSLSGDDTSEISWIEDLTEFVAMQTEGMTGAGIVAVCDEAKLRCARGLYEEKNDSDVYPVLSREHFIDVLHSPRT